MAQLNTKVKLYLEANSKVYSSELNNYVLQNDSDGNGDYIKSWNVSGLTEPTAEQLATYEDAANAEESNQAVKSYITKRKTAYPPIGDQLDMLWHSIDKNPDLKTQYFDFYEAIKAVKVKYGKDD
jgi:hypothetical protein